MEEKWIPAVYADGRKEEISLYQALLDAHLITGFYGLNCMFEYSLYRFLILFVTCVYMPGQRDDIVVAYKKGCIDKELLDLYIDRCKAEGVTFDVFDKERPFLQSPYDDAYDSDKNIKPVTSLDYSIPSGSSVTLFNNVHDEDSVMPVSKVLLCLVAVQIFATAMVQGYPSNVSGAPPVYYLLNGKMLFETLVFSMPLLRDEEFELDSDEREIWCNTKIVVPKEQVPEVSLLFGLLFPCRRVTLIPDDGKFVRRCYMRQGLNFIGYDSFVDPFVLYKTENEKRFSVKPNVSRDLWRNIGSLYLMFGKKDECFSSIVGQYASLYDELFGSKVISLRMYGVVTSQAEYVAMQYGEFSVDSRIGGDPSKVELVVSVVGQIDEIGDKLFKTLQWLVKDCNISCNSVIQQFVSMYFAACEKLFYHFCDDLVMVVDDKSRLACIDNFQEAMIKVAFGQYDKFVGTVFRDSFHLYKTVKCRFIFMSTCKNILGIEKSVENNKSKEKTKESGK